MRNMYTVQRFLGDICRYQACCMLINRLELALVIVLTSVTFVIMKTVLAMTYMTSYRPSLQSILNMLRMTSTLRVNHMLGHYIPAFAARVHKGNKAKEGIHINLKGFAIGNGLTDPAVQYKAYPDYALDTGIIEKADYDRINKVMVPACELAIKLCGTNGKISCMASYFVCNTIFSAILSRAGDTNYYDIRKKCEGSLCYDFSNMEKFLNQISVRDALGVGDIDFVSCSPTVYQAMLVDWMRNLEAGIPALLEDGINLLVYAGEYDLICNWLGNSRWVHAVEWSGQKEFVASHEVPFVVDGSEAGLLKNHGPLSFLKVHDAGHMVPMDQPKASLEMMKKWTQGSLSEFGGNEAELVAEV